MTKDAISEVNEPGKARVQAVSARLIVRRWAMFKTPPHIGTVWHRSYCCCCCCCCLVLVCCVSRENGLSAYTITWHSASQIVRMSSDESVVTSRIANSCRRVAGQVCGQCSSICCCCCCLATTCCSAANTSAERWNASERRRSVRLQCTAGAFVRSVS